MYKEITVKTKIRTKPITQGKYYRKCDKERSERERGREMADQAISRMKDRVRERERERCVEECGFGFCGFYFDKWNGPGLQFVPEICWKLFAV